VPPSGGYRDGEWIGGETRFSEAYNYLEGTLEVEILEMFDGPHTVAVRLGGDGTVAAEADGTNTLPGTEGDSGARTRTHGRRS
jgi:hypothetical protein